MKVVAFNSSARKDGNTATLVRQVFEELEKEGIETQLVQFADISGGEAVAGFDLVNKNDYSTNKTPDDRLTPVIDKIINADAVILASPTYVGDASASMRALIERITLQVKFMNKNPLALKVGAAVVSHRRAGAVQALNSINSFFAMNEMVTVGSCYMNVGLGKELGEVRDDAEGERTMRTLGRNMAHVMKKLAQ